MTLEEYEQLFLKERSKKKEKDVKVVCFVSGLLIGQITGVIALALVSINRGHDD